MLHEFLTANHQELIDRCKGMGGRRLEPAATPGAIDYGAPLFLQQLATTLRLEQKSSYRESDESDESDESLAHQPKKRNEIGTSAALQGAELLRRGYTIEQVVHCYGDMCQSVTGLAIEKAMIISTDEFRTLNRCLDNAIAEAVSAFGTANQTLVEARALDNLPGRLAEFVSEERRLVEIAIQSYTVIKSGGVGISGATASLLGHALEELQSLIERTPPEIQLKAPPPPKGRRCSRTGRDLGRSKLAARVAVSHRRSARSPCAAPNSPPQLLPELAG